jgi:hypothetical protein
MFVQLHRNQMLPVNQAAFDTQAVIPVELRFYAA